MNKVAIGVSDVEAINKRIQTRPKAAPQDTRIDFLSKADLFKTLTIETLTNPENHDRRRRTVHTGSRPPGGS